MEIKQNLVCQMCKEAGTVYKVNGLCVYQAMSKESNPGERLPECSQGATSIKE